jgi:hypothetical protein
VRFTKDTTWSAARKCQSTSTTTPTPRHKIQHACICGVITMNNQRRLYNIAASRPHRIEEEEAMMLVNSAESVNTNPAIYKLFTADTSQVYCGRSLLPNHKKKNDAADDDKIGLASILASSYRPARTRRPNIVPRDDGDDPAKTDLHRRSSTDSDSSMSTSTDGSSGSGSRRRSSTTSADGGTLRRRNSSSSVASGGGPTLRRKCQPLHRDQSFNQSVSSIMRPSRYSMTSSTHSLSSELNDSLHSSSQAPTTTAAPPKPRRISRRATLDGLPAPSMHTDFQRETYKRSNSDHQWVASGVDFSSSVEVYVFRK